MPDLSDQIDERLSRLSSIVTQRSIAAGRPLPPEAVSNDVKLIKESGLAAIKKLKEKGPDVQFAADETAAAESIVLIIERPALLVYKGTFALAEAPWKEPLEHAADDINLRLPSIGRIEVVMNGVVQEVATGFLVGDDRVMTNRHVIKAIGTPTPDNSNAGNPTRWKINRNMRPQINFKAEYDPSNGVDESRVYPVVDEIMETHPDYPKIDMGLLRIDKTSPHSSGPVFQQKLGLASEPPDFTKSADVYVVGYPASDNQGAIPPAVMRSVFGGIFEVKRLSPGKIMNEFDDRVFAHDCSTLGGSSGSCVIDLRTQKVIGLHFQGSYGKANYAVSLWRLKQDPLIKNAGLKYD
jgi:V8-like Glu-specific endopeptidase